MAIVAAASKGLGRPVAEEFARKGAEVAICSRKPAGLEKAAAQIRKAGGREVFWRALDVFDSAAVTEFVAAVEIALEGWTFALRIPVDLRLSYLRPQPTKIGRSGRNSC